jgi:hypothetical protein
MQILHPFSGSIQEHDHFLNAARQGAIPSIRPLAGYFAPLGDRSRPVTA